MGKSREPVTWRNVLDGQLVIRLGSRDSNHAFGAAAPSGEVDILSKTVKFRRLNLDKMSISRQFVHKFPL